MLNWKSANLYVKVMLRYGQRGLPAPIRLIGLVCNPICICDCQLCCVMCEHSVLYTVDRDDNVFVCRQWSSC